MTIRKSIYTILLLCLVLVSCDSGFEQVNTNPNEPVAVPSEVLMTSGTRSSMNSMVNESFLLANNIAQLSAKTLRTEVDDYRWNAFSTLWQDQYRALADLVDAERLAAEEGEQATQGAAVILQSWIYTTLTMAYGDIPYSEAISGTETGNYVPAYDTQENILDGEGGILDRLQEAEDLLAQAVTNNQSVGGDLIYNGDASKWKKLANVLQLRVLMHLSNKRDVSNDMQSILNEGDIFTSNNDNATLTFLNSFPNDYPLFPLKQGDFDAVVLAEPLVNTFNTYNDPRLGVYGRPDNITDLGTFQSSNALYSGAENGSETGGCNKGGSRLGARYYDYPSHPSGEERANGIISTYAEQELILAEASFKGIIPSDIETHYQNGIEASMTYYNVNTEVFGWTNFTDFYNNSGVSSNIDLTKIWEQKWIASFFHGMEPFFDVRRMVYEQGNGINFSVGQVPFLSAPCANNNNDELPVRFLYPGNEQSLNSENYEEAINRFANGAGNTQNALMYLMQN